VKPYINYELFELGVAQVGYVETEHCKNEWNAGVSKRHLIKRLKVKAQKLAGNDFIFDFYQVHFNASCLF
jgi:hypothetical protein